MASHHHDGIYDFFHRFKEFNLCFFILGKPSERDGIRMIPSALVNEVITPEPLGNGVAKNFPPTCAYLHPQKLFRSQFGRELSRREDLDLWSFRHHDVERLIEHGPHQSLVGNDCGDRITREFR